MRAKPTDHQSATRLDLEVLRAEVICAVALLLLAHLGGLYAMLP